MWNIPTFRFHRSVAEFGWSLTSSGHNRWWYWNEIWKWSIQHHGQWCITIWSCSHPERSNVDEVCLFYIASLYFAVSFSFSFLSPRYLNLLISNEPWVNTLKSPHNGFQLFYSWFGQTTLKIHLNFSAIKWMASFTGTKVTQGISITRKTTRIPGQEQSVFAPPQI